jgi:hypothetical protein
MNTFTRAWPYIHIVLLLTAIILLSFSMIRPEPGDMNGDGEINLTDLSILAAQINTGV